MRRRTLQRQFVEYLIAEDLEQPVKPPLLVLSLLPDQFLAEIIAQQAGCGCERQRELLRPADAFRRGREESLQQLRDRLDAILAQSEFRLFEVRRVAQRLALVDHLC